MRNSALLGVILLLPAQKQNKTRCGRFHHTNIWIEINPDAQWGTQSHLAASVQHWRHHNESPFIFTHTSPCFCFSTVQSVRTQRRLVPIIFVEKQQTQNSVGTSVRTWAWTWSRPRCRWTASSRWWWWCDSFHPGSPAGSESSYCLCMGRGFSINTWQTRWTQQ